MDERTSTSTIGFAVVEEDQERLARLVEHFGHGKPVGVPAGDGFTGQGGAAAGAPGS